MSDAFSLDTLLKKEAKELYGYARELGIEDFAQMSKKELALTIARAQEEKQGFFIVEGVLDIMPSGEYGVLRPINYSPSKEDIYTLQIRKFAVLNCEMEIK